MSRHISASRKRNHFRKNVGEERGFPKPLVNAEMHGRRITVSKILEFKIWSFGYFIAFFVSQDTFANLLLLTHTKTSALIEVMVVSLVLASLKVIQCVKASSPHSHDGKR